MKAYWDSGALIEVLRAPGPARTTFETADDEPCTRVHSLAEMFATLTGGRLGFRMEGDDAAAAIAAWSKQLTLWPQDGPATLAALALARRRGARGAGVHDWLHCHAAETHGAKLLYTVDADLEKLTKLKVVRF